MDAPDLSFAGKFRMGTFYGGFPTSKTSTTKRCDTWDTYVKRHDPKDPDPPVLGEQAAIFLLPTFRLKCSGCGFIPEKPYSLMAVQRHCLGRCDSGGCPAFMAKHHAFLNIKKGFPKKLKNQTEQPPGSFVRATLAKNWGLCPPSPDDADDNDRLPAPVANDGKDQAYWEALFEQTINENKAVGYSGFVHHRFKKDAPAPIPRLRQDIAETYAHLHNGIHFLQGTKEGDPDLPFYIEQVKSIRVASNLSRDDWDPITLPGGRVFYKDGAEDDSDNQNGKDDDENGGDDDDDDDDNNDDDTNMDLRSLGLPPHNDVLPRNMAEQFSPPTSPTKKKTARKKKPTVAKKGRNKKSGASSNTRSRRNSGSGRPARDRKLPEHFGIYDIPGVEDSDLPGCI